MILGHALPFDSPISSRLRSSTEALTVLLGPGEPAGHGKVTVVIAPVCWGLLERGQCLGRGSKSFRHLSCLTSPRGSGPCQKKAFTVWMFYFSVVFLKACLTPAGSLGSMRLLLVSVLEAEFPDLMPVSLYSVYGGFFPSKHASPFVCFVWSAPSGLSTSEPWGILRNGLSWNVLPFY